MNFRFRYLQLAMGCLLLLACGCGGGDVGTVEGIVTLDGKPLDQASVAFYPTDGRASMGFTDKDGKYQLTYTQGTNGAVIGEHKVTISTEVDEEVEYGDSDYEEEDSEGVTEETNVSEARDETMPAKYRDRNQTVLSATVKSGSNKIDFDLESE